MEFTVQQSDRLDTFLATLFPDTSRARIQKRIKNGAVHVNAVQMTKVAHALSKGDIVTIESDTLDVLPEKKSSIQPVDLTLEILYEDKDCFVLCKPAEITVHPGHSTDPEEVTLLQGIAYEFLQRGIPFRSDSVLVHRLDKDTTGCILIAKTPDAHFFMQKQFEARTVTKQYLAIVFGVPKHSSAIIDAPIGRNMNDRTKMSIVQTSSSRPAKTGYEVLSVSNQTTLLRCDLFTGRTHQIRVHLASIDYPIIGDNTYGSPACSRFSASNHIDQICLHAWKLSFTDLDGNDVHVECKPPDYFQSIQKKLGLATN